MKVSELFEQPVAELQEMQLDESEVFDLMEKEWSEAVTNGPAYTFARKGTHTKPAAEIVAEYKRKGVAPKGLGSAIRMLQFFINRAGKNLKPERKNELQKAIRMLQADLKKEHEQEAAKKKKKHKK